MDYQKTILEPNHAVALVLFLNAFTLPLFFWGTKLRAAIAIPVHLFGFAFLLLSPFLTFKLGLPSFQPDEVPWVGDSLFAGPVIAEVCVILLAYAVFMLILFFSKTSARSKATKGA